MGRSNTLPEDFTGEVTVRVVPLDSGGYDPGGAYWGTAGTLYCVEDFDGRARYARDLVPIGDAKVVTVPASADDLVDVVQGYIEAALFSSTTDAGDPLDDKYSETDLAPETLAQMKADCEAFIAGAALDLTGEGQRGAADGGGPRRRAAASRRRANGVAARAAAGGQQHRVGLRQHV